MMTFIRRAIVSLLMKKLFTLPLFAVCLMSCSSPIEERALHDEALAIAQDYMRDQGASGGFAQMSVSSTDLNGDGLDDVFVHIWDEPSVCTGQGCAMLVFENRGNSLKLISDIRNVYVRLDSRPGESAWSTLVVASRDALGKDHVGGEPATVYELAFDSESQQGYPRDATKGRLQTW